MDNLKNAPKEQYQKHRMKSYAKLAAKISANGADSYLDFQKDANKKAVSE